MLEGLEEYRKATSKRCSFGRMLETLDQKDQDILAAALEDRERWTTHALYRALADFGLDVGQTPVYRHRDGLCSCGGANARES